MMNAETFEPPKIVRFVGSLFDFLSQSTLVMFSNDRQAQAKYIKELFGMISLLLLAWILWSFLLLSCRADCLSGKGFCFDDSETQSLLTSDEEDDAASTFENDQEDCLDQRSIVTNAAVLTTCDKSETGNDASVDRNGSNRCLCIMAFCCSDEVAPMKRRLKLIRIAFLLFGILSAICGALVFPKTYSPMINAAETTSHHLKDVQFIVATIKRALKVIHQTADAAQHIHNDLDAVLDGLCPGMPPYDLAQELGVDPRDVVLLLERGYAEFTESSGNAMAQVDDSTTKIDALIRNVETGIQEAQDRMWIFPLLVLCTTILTVVSLLAVFWVMIQESFPSTHHALSQISFEHIMAWAILPLLVFLTFALWILTSAFSIGAVVVTDICLPSPDDSIHSILLSQGMDVESFLGKAISSYTSGCNVDDPIEMLRVIEEILYSNVDIIGDRLQEALASFDRLELLCGPDNKIDIFFSGMGRLYYHLTNVYNILVESRTVLECPNIHELYKEIVHDTVCSEFGMAIADGVVLMFLISISGMILITLRGAWHYLG